MKILKFSCPPLLYSYLWLRSKISYRNQFDKAHLMKFSVFWLVTVAFIVYGISQIFAIEINNAMAGSYQEMAVLLVAGFGRGGMLIQIMLVAAVIGMFFIPRDGGSSSVHFWEGMLGMVGLLAVLVSLYYSYSFGMYGFPDTYVYGEQAFTKPVFPFSAAMIAQTITGLLIVPIVLACSVPVGYYCLRADVFTSRSITEYCQDNR